MRDVSGSQVTNCSVISMPYIGYSLVLVLEGEDVIASFHRPESINSQSDWLLRQQSDKHFIPGLSITSNMRSRAPFITFQGFQRMDLKNGCFHIQEAPAALDPKRGYQARLTRSLRRLNWYEASNTPISLPDYQTGWVIGYTRILRRVCGKCYGTPLCKKLHRMHTRQQKASCSYLNTWHANISLITCFYNSSRWEHETFAWNCEQEKASASTKR